MKTKRTLSNWLTNRYQLVIRNEENFAEKTSLSFTYAKVIVVLSVVFIVLFVASLYLSQTLLARWFDPRFEQMMVRQELLTLVDKVDSLALEVDRKEQFIQNMQRVLRGDTSAFTDPVKLRTGPAVAVKPEGLQLAPSDSQFRKDFERSDLALITLTSSRYRELQETFFFTPINGFISDRFDIKKGHYGVDIVAKSNEPVKNIADGMVVFASWTQDAGYVMMIQHKGNLISVYKHNAELYKKVGTFVYAGEIIAIVGNSGELTNGPHLHFELWYNGNPLNPEEFVTF
ncbi:MAG: M23 family metallopeptidase [Cyclobacteriaceae bacterium]|nr:M23 family metallopeptidase [Cyclobacteriaceae bacterium]MCX7637059.1 M23 family metallopeptidase [Cyclobacteriaceae bacterium]MDW8331183.1 M23 family metallopeptidase [Cyclobacteriaceae bacterium]